MELTSHITKIVNCIRERISKVRGQLGNGMKSLVFISTHHLLHLKCHHLGFHRSRLPWWGVVWGRLKGSQVVRQDTRQAVWLHSQGVSPVSGGVRSCCFTELVLCYSLVSWTVLQGGMCVCVCVSRQETCTFSFVLYSSE